MRQPIIRWEPYNKDDEVLCWRAEKGDYELYEIHEAFQEQDGPRHIDCRKGSDPEFVAKIAEGLNLVAWRSPAREDGSLRSRILESLIDHYENDGGKSWMEMLNLDDDAEPQVEAVLREVSAHLRKLVRDKRAM